MKSFFSEKKIEYQVNHSGQSEPFVSIYLEYFDLWKWFSKLFSHFKQIYYAMGMSQGIICVVNETTNWKFIEQFLDGHQQDIFILCWFDIQKR